jgi:hypothetical protein
MIPRRRARKTRHAIVFASAKYVEPRIGFISLGTEGARMRAVEAIATPIVTLWYEFRLLFTGENRTNDN